jgi:hypothetical protein
MIKTIEGKVLSVNRGSSTQIDSNKFLTLVIEHDKETHKADLPIKTESQFELMPYQIALVGTNVRYNYEWSEAEKGFGLDGAILQDWNLEILSGPLKGNKYFGNYTAPIC